MLPKLRFIRTQLVNLHYFVSQNRCECTCTLWGISLKNKISLKNNKNKDLKLKTFYFSAKRIKCRKNDNKKIRVGDQKFGTVGNQKHTYFFIWP